MVCVAGSPKRQRSEKGFTLIEVMVVVAIIAFLSVLALPSIGNFFQVSINSATRTMASTIKEAYNSTLITGDVHRLAYDFKEQKFWVERGPADAVLETQASLEREARRVRFKSESDQDKEAEERAKGGFEIAKSVTRKKISLPTGVEFEAVYTQLSKDPIKAGTAYTHFFPSGITEQTIVHLKDSSDHKVSLVIEPLIGRSEVFNHEVTPAEVFGK